MKLNRSQWWLDQHESYIIRCWQKLEIAELCSPAYLLSQVVCSEADRPRVFTWPNFKPPRNRLWNLSSAAWLYPYIQVSRKCKRKLSITPYRIAAYPCLPRDTPYRWKCWEEAFCRTRWAGEGSEPSQAYLNVRPPSISVLTFSFLPWKFWTRHLVNSKVYFWTRSIFLFFFFFVRERYFRNCSQQFAVGPLCSIHYLSM